MICQNPLRRNLTNPSVIHLVLVAHPCACFGDRPIRIPLQHVPLRAGEHISAMLSSRPLFQCVRRRCNHTTTLRQPHVLPFCIVHMNGSASMPPFDDLVMPSSAATIQCTTLLPHRRFVRQRQRLCRQNRVRHPVQPPACQWEQTCLALRSLHGSSLGQHNATNILRSSFRNIPKTSV